ncbi:MAG: hypothetical protein K0S47_1687 [Herbinix sp.]|nr:hypothetical protein [Herbinix sp.]
MKRKLIDKLIEWKTSINRQPILLSGAKGVGKTYLAYDFAKSFFQDVFYLNFEREPALSNLLQKKSPEQFWLDLYNHFHIVAKNSNVNERILILDEINYCRTIQDLTNLYQDQINFPFIMTIISEPIKDVCFKELAFSKLTLYPMEFDEFLRATGNEWYIEAISNHYEANKKVPEIVHNELLALHQLYLQIGGMPGVVNEYISLSSPINVAEQQGFLLNSYHQIISKNTMESDALKINQVLESIPHQLLKENKKFQYKLIRKGTTYSMYKEAIEFLEDHNYILRCHKIPDEYLIQTNLMNSNPYDLVEDLSPNFKLYLPDIGLLTSQIAEQKTLDLQNYISKAVLENYVAQVLHTKGYPLWFWDSNSMAKIEFVIRKEDVVIPVELFTNDNTRSKSISILKQKIDFPYSVKISSKNFELSNQVKYVPYYAVFCL